MITPLSLSIHPIWLKVMTKLFTGGCLCGAVRYQSKSKPESSVICHCKDCQKYSGTAFSAVVFIPINDLSISGELSSFNLKVESGHTVTRTFCKTCGSHITEGSDGYPDLAVVTTGTLDDPSWATPMMQCFTSRQHSWVKLDSSIPAFKAMPED